MLTNARITDILTRHQIYLEGVKNYEALQFNGVMRKLADAIKLEFVGLEAKTLDGLTKAQLRKLIIKLREVQASIYSQYTKEVIDRLQSIMAIDLAVQKTVYRSMALDLSLGEVPAEDLPKPPTKADPVDAPLGPQAKEENGLLPALMLTGGAIGLRRLWAAVTGAVLPSNGVLPLVMLAGMTGAAAEGVLRTVSQGYANRTPTAEVLRKLVGTSALKNRDGQIAKVFSQASAVTDTLIQHITSIIGGGVASKYFGEYMWQSVIDSVTTDICRERNGQVWQYGRGPLPPAHIRCRSKAVPVVGDIPKPPTFFAWIKMQPPAVQDDILGKARAELLRAGKLKAADLPKFDSIGAISPDEFKRKLGLILTR